MHDAATGVELEVGKGHHGPVHAVMYSPDGELYASGSEDGTLLFFLLLPSFLSTKESLIRLGFARAGTVRLWQTSPKDYGLWRYNPHEEGTNGQ